MTTAPQFAQRVKSYGFRVWLDRTQEHGFISDDTLSRVIPFQFTGNDPVLEGNHGAPSSRRATGWKPNDPPYGFKVKADVQAALYAPNVAFSLDGGQSYLTVAQYLAFCPTSHFAEVV